MTTNITVRIDEEVKRDAETLFEKLGMSFSGAINIFIRQAIREQAIREQAIPFSIRLKTAEEKYNEYFTPSILKELEESYEQARRGEIITFTIDELIAMEDGEIPQRAIDFLEAHKKAGN